MKPLNRTESQNVTRLALQEAAARLIAERGYAGASIRDITKLAGYTQGAFHSNFKNKEELLLAAIQSHLEQAQVDFKSLLAQNQDPKKLRLGFQKWAESFDYQSPRACLQIEADLHARRDSEFAKSYRQLIREHKAALTRLIKLLATDKGGKSEPTADQISSGLYALTRGLIVDGTIDQNKAKGAVLNLFFQAVLG